MQLSNIIIGGGLAGLLLAWRLEQRGLPYTLLEAKPQLGGRILGVQDNQQPEHHHDLGPTWIFPHQHHIQQLLAELNITMFEQYAIGDALFQQKNNQNIIRSNGAGAMKMYRVNGGVTTLINALYRRLDVNNIKTNHVVKHVSKNNKRWDISVQHKKSTITFDANNLILALPPRMINTHLTPEHWASTSLKNSLDKVPTWMAAQAKFVTTYKSAFWRDNALSGQAFSQQAPMQEMHDACADNNAPYAMFGFIGIPARYRIQHNELQIEQACLNQFDLLYSEHASHLKTTYYKDWATDEFVASNQDLNEQPAHPDFPMNSAEKELTEKSVFLAASEFSQVDAGYLEGAVCSVNNVIIKLLNNQP